ncbi:MAG: MerR family transcriptional regulator [Deltaproteobacteria bacterium]|nr:MerR family transcriptional regulator [Deltaproteobacteria bacterium]
MKGTEKYTIRYVSKNTGLKPHILRVWEKRYSAVVPRRTETNRRIYTSSDIYRLQLLKNAVASGHAISHVASLRNEDIENLNYRAEATPSEAAKEESPGEVVNCGDYVSEALKHVARLDPVAFENVLERAAVTLSRPRLLNDVIQPLFREIGELWASGQLKIIHEHMASIVIRSFLSDMLRGVVLADTAFKIVVAAPVGQWHETGALVVALTAAESGWRPLYFGPNLPAEEIAAAVRLTAAKATALSISHRTDIGLVIRELRKLKSFCTRRVQIYVGGYGVLDLKERVDLLGVRCIVNVDEFRAELEAY